MTTQSCLKTALLALGWEVIIGKSSRYIVMQRPNKPGKLLYLGRRGALRYGKNIANSRPVDNYKVELLGN